MADSVNDSFSMDDEILAIEFDHDLNDFNEVKTTLHSTNKDCASIISSNKKLNSININRPILSKKCSSMQSRLSTFFKKSDNDQMCQEETKCELINNADEFCVKLNSPHVPDEVNISSSPNIFYKEPDFEGFHLFSGSHYVYPSNYPIREYQMKIIKTALYHNTLIILPTGLGKTFMASVVMYNFYRWYPLCKIIFIAPTKPLISQQIEACHSVGFPKELTIDMTGNVSPEHRYQVWGKKRIFFFTPQVLLNDLKQNKCPSKLIKCIVFDEAHRTTNDYAYVEVLKYVQNENQRIRIIGLSAIPGNNVESIIEVIKNLNISKLEFRTEDSPDVIKYTNTRNINYISVKLTDDILNIRSQFLVIYNKYSRRLKQTNLLNGNITNLTKCQLFAAKQKFLNSHNNMTQSLKECIIDDFDICMSLAFVLELLITYGVKVFYLKLLEIMENHNSLLTDADLKKIVDYSKSQIHCQDLTWSHPKLFELKQIVQNYFGVENIKKNKIVIFCQYQFVVNQLYELLKTFGSNVKPVMSVDQSLKDKSGLLQKKQLEVMNQYKNGYYNVLIVTTVAEDVHFEGVDLIISLEANKFPIKFIQRLSRAGQKCPGKCITLLTEGKELAKYKSSVEPNNTVSYKILENPLILSNLATFDGPSLIPKHINPQLLMIHIKDSKDKLKKSKRNDKQLIDKSNKHKITNEFIEDHKSLSVSENNTNCNFEPNFINNICDNAFIVNTSTEVCNLDNFFNENKTYNEWKKMSKHSNTDFLNKNFFKLLCLFTDCSSENDPYCDNEILMNSAYFHENNQENGIMEKSIDQNEMVSISYSPELPNTKLSKEILHQLTNCSRASSPEIINLLSPEFATNEDENKIIIKDNIDSLLCCNVNNTFPTPTNAINKINDLFLVQKNDDIITQKKHIPDNNVDIFTQYECASTNHLDNTISNKQIKKNMSNTQRPLMSTIDTKSSLNVNSKTEVLVTESYNNMFLPSNIIKACNLIKPGFSLKRNIIESKQQFDDQLSMKLIIESPIKIQEMRQSSKFSQSTPKMSISVQTKRPQKNIPIQTETVNFLTSSSDESDVFVGNSDNHHYGTNNKTMGSHRRLKKIHPKRKKLVFIDDEADVSNCNNYQSYDTINMNKIISDDEDENDDNEDFDSSFIDDEKDVQSTSMTKHYLQSLKSPANTRGAFKIPKLTNRHYNINVYSQMDNKNESCYMEDSFCVEDTSDMNSSSNTSIENISDRLPLKRRRILSPQSSDSDNN